MKKIVWMIFALHIQCNFAQLAENSNPKRLNLFLAPDYCNRLNVINNNFSASENFKNQLDSLYRGKMGFTLGASWILPLSNNWSFETGVVLANKAIKTIMGDASHFVVSDPNDPYLPVSWQSKYNDIFLDLPAKINYQFNKNQFNYFVGGGLVMNASIITIDKTSYTYQNNTRDSHVSVYSALMQSVNVSGTVGIGMEYLFSNKVRWRIEPNIQSSILDLNQGFAKIHPYSVGIKMGITIEL
jgi:hypothetical protein